jgi:PAS domain S-box-containing protein
MADTPGSIDPSGAEQIRQRELESALEANEQLTRGILAAVPVGVVHVAIDGQISTANAQALRTLGLGYDELTNRYTTDFETTTLWEDGTVCKVEDYPVSRALATGEAQAPVIIGVRRPDGATAWCVFRAVPVKDAGGTTTGAIVTFHDITDRKVMEDALRRSEAKLQAIVTSAPGTIFTSDCDGRFTFINRTKTAGVTPESVIGRSMFSWVNEAEHPMLRDKIRRVVEHGETVEYEVAGLAGVDHDHYATRIGPILRDGVVIGIAGVVTVITERKRAEEERVRLLAQLNEAQRLEALGRLAGGVAHDFNNLLTVIRGNVDLVSRRLEGTTLAQRLEEVASAAARAASLTRQLLAFGGRQALEPRVLDLRAVVTGLEPMLRRLLSEHVTLHIDHEPGELAVRADPVEIERVIVNLTMNAQDAMPRGGTVRIHTAAHLAAEPSPQLPAGPWAVLEVADSGDGMDPETLAHAFEPFFTTKSDRVVAGGGLGLATVHGIVKQSGGHVLVDTAAGQGTRFRVMLPKVDERPAEPRAHPRRPRETQRETVLLVEDEISVRDATCRILEAEGYRVIAAASPQAALGLADDVLASVKLLLTDVVMPQHSGPDVAVALQARAPHIKVLLMSGHVQDRIGDLSPGYAFLAKPFDLETLCAKVRGVLDA